MSAPSEPFRSWLARQTDRNDPVGDVARDCRDDEECMASDISTSLEVLHHMMDEHSASTLAIRALLRAEREWLGEDGGPAKQWLVAEELA